jgi:hypothetical protein
MCQSGETCLAKDCCFSELALYKSSLACWSSTKWTSLSSHPIQLVLAMIWLKICLIGIKQQSFTPLYISGNLTFTFMQGIQYCSSLPVLHYLRVVLYIKI